MIEPFGLRHFGVATGEHFNHISGVECVINMAFLAIDHDFVDFVEIKLLDGSNTI